MQLHAIDVVDHAKTIRPHDGEAGLARDLGDGVLRVLTADFAKPAAKIIAEPTLRRAQASIASRTLAAGNVNTARSTPSGKSSGTLQHGPAVDRLGLRPTR